MNKTVSESREYWSSRDAKLEAVGKSFINAAGIKYSIADETNGFLLSTGVIVAASKINHLSRPEEVGERDWLGEELTEAIWSLLRRREWHHQKIIYLAVTALIKRELVLAREKYVATGIEKTFFFRSEKSKRLERDFLAWENYLNKCFPPSSAFSCRESFRSLTSLGVAVPPCLFDLCELWGRFEDQALSSSLGDLFPRAVPGKFLDYSVQFNQADKPDALIKKETGERVDLREVYGAKLRLTCEPKRMQLLHDNRGRVHLLHFGVREFCFGFHEGYSRIGQDQMFLIHDSRIITLPDNFLVQIQERQLFDQEQRMISVARGSSQMAESSAIEKSQVSFGIGAISCWPAEAVAEGWEVNISLGLDEEIIGSMVQALESGSLKNIRFGAFLFIDSGYTTAASSFEGQADFIFSGSREARIEISDFAIEYDVGKA